MCNQQAGLQKHHLHRRRTTPSYWIEVEFPGIVMVLPNIVQLCAKHHLDVTGGVGGHQAQIVYAEGSGSYVWQTAPRSSEMALDAPLAPEPPMTFKQPDREAQWRELFHPTDADEEAAALEAREYREEDELTEECPTCKGRGIRPRVARKDEIRDDAQPQPKRTWSVAIPKQERAHGYDSIEALIEHVAEILGRKGHKAFKYYCLCEALAFVVQNQTHITREEVEA